jgi:hypothetical protein
MKKLQLVEQLFGLEEQGLALQCAEDRALQ